MEGRIKSSPHLKPATAHYNAQIAASLRSALPLAQSAAKWTIEAVASWWKGYAAQRSTQRVNASLRMLKMLGEVMKENRLRPENPFHDLKPRKTARAELMQMPSAGQMETLIASVRGQGKRSSEESAHMIAWLAWSGMRIAEVRGLKWEDIGQDWIIVTGGPGGTKNREQRRIPLHDRLRTILDALRWPDAAGPVFSMVSPRGALDNACERLGMPHLRVHDLRHWFATHAIERGVDVPTVAKWLGHKDGGVLAMKTYAHARDTHSLESAKKL